MTDRTYTEEEIRDLTDRVFLLREELDAGRIHFASHLLEGFRLSYEAIRLRPDGLVDPHSVDGRIRSATLMIQMRKRREEAKTAVSLREIQDTYFAFIFREFDWLFQRMLKSRASPTQVARAMSNDPEYVGQVTKGIPQMAEVLEEFWGAVGDSGAYHLQDSRQLKATFGGDIFPAHWENLVSTAGLYIDTIILPCPVMRVAPLFGVLPESEVAALFTKHVLTAMMYREVATADVEPPIALVLPNASDAELENRKELVTRAEPFMLKHAAYLFGREFESIEHLQGFCCSLATIDQVFAELKGADRLLFDTEWESDPRVQLAQAMKRRSAGFGRMDPSLAGTHVLSACFGRMPQALAAQENALHVGGIPLINAETSWLYYTWMLEYQSARSPGDIEHKTGLHVARALVAESPNNLAWLGNVPPETVLEIRRNGCAEELRSLLGRGVADLVALRPDNYHRSADQVVENLNAAFALHQQDVLAARQKKLKLYGIDVGSCIATGAIAVTAALTANPTLGAVSGLLGIAGLPNLRDIKSAFKTVAEEDRIRKTSPAGLLFRHL